MVPKGDIVRRGRRCRIAIADVLKQAITQEAGLRSSANSSSGFIAPSPSLRMSWLKSIGRVVTPLILAMQS